MNTFKITINGETLKDVGFALNIIQKEIAAGVTKDSYADKNVNFQFGSEFSKPLTEPFGESNMENASDVFSNHQEVNYPSMTFMIDLDKEVITELGARVHELLVHGNVSRFNLISTLENAELRAKLTPIIDRLKDFDIVFGLIDLATAATTFKNNDDDTLKERNLYDYLREQRERIPGHIQTYIKELTQNNKLDEEGLGNIKVEAEILEERMGMYGLNKNFTCAELMKKLKQEINRKQLHLML